MCKERRDRREHERVRKEDDEARYIPDIDRYYYTHY